MKRKIRIYPTACRFLAIALTAGLGLSMYGCQGTSGSSNGNRLDASLIREDNTAAGPRIGFRYIRFGRSRLCLI